MKKIICAAALSLAALTTPAFAELEKVYACQYTDAAGLYFEDGNWATTDCSLKPPFFIKTDGSTIVSADGLFEEHISCTSRYAKFQCGDQYGGTVYFNSDTKKGGVSQLFGAQLDDDKRDTVSVSLFVCEAM